MRVLINGMIDFYGHNGCPCQSRVIALPKRLLSIAPFKLRNTRRSPQGRYRPFRCFFLVADVKHPVLGAYFLGYHSFLIDVRNKAFKDSQNKLQIGLMQTPPCTLAYNT